MAGCGAGPRAARLAAPVPRGVFQGVPARRPPGAAEGTDRPRGRGRRGGPLDHGLQDGRPSHQARRGERLDRAPAPRLRRRRGGGAPRAAGEQASRRSPHGGLCPLEQSLRGGSCSLHGHGKEPDWRALSEDWARIAASRLEAPAQGHFQADPWPDGPRTRRTKAPCKNCGFHALCGFYDDPGRAFEGEEDVRGGGIMTGDWPARLRALDPRRSFIVKAPAGSGKTELLTARYLALLAAGGPGGAPCTPGQILAVTFTDKAALEMKARIALWLERAADPSLRAPERLGPGGGGAGQGRVEGPRRQGRPPAEPHGLPRGDVPRVLRLGVPGVARGIGHPRGCRRSWTTRANSGSSKRPCVPSSPPSGTRRLRAPCGRPWSAGSRPSTTAPAGWWASSPPS